MSEHRKLFAVLIDGDNVQPSYVQLILAKIRYLGGDPLVRKVCINKTSIPPWEDVINEYSLDPLWVPNNKKGKNASDIALVIEGMDLFHTRKELTGFCIVSSDSDFTQLAKYITHRSKIVYGFGEEAKVVRSFSNACTEFFFLEELQRAQKMESSVIIPESEKLDQPVIDFGSNLSFVDVTPTNHSLPSFEVALIQYYLSILHQSPDPEGWVTLSAIYDQLTAGGFTFQSRRSLADKVKELAQIYLNVFEINERLENKPVIHYIRIDCDTFRFLHACKYAADEKKLKDEHDSVILSVVKSTLQELYPDLDPQLYHDRRFNQFLKIARKIEEDYPIIRVVETTDGKTQPKVQWLTANSQ